MSINRTMKKALIAGLILSSNAYADSHYYYEEEGQLLFKFKGFYSQLDSTKTTFTSSVASTTSSKDLVSSAYGAEGSATYFYNANWSTELSAGFGIMHLRKSEFNKIASIIGINGGTITKKNVNMIPVSAIVQYHVAPYGAIRPYAGLGYSGTYLNAKSKKFSIDTASGAVLQLGVDFVTKNDNFFTLEIKKYYLKPKFTLERSFLDPVDESIAKTSSNMKINPLTISLGFGFRV
ncbi:MAG TPA: OmpW family outer membrane protein [Candidatus Megaira endosymbiont of Nemacystus decipiens]|nr:OmpW family outer membrane protein [Candidatus Megaera endosymbiont of Nemacystus decipiens]